MTELASEASEPAVGSGRIMRNSVWSALGNAIPLIAVVISVPMLLRELGDTQFGLLSLLLAVLAYSGALNLGLGKATTRTTASILETDPRGTGIGVVVGSSLVAQVIFGLLGAAALAAVSAPLARVAGFEGADLHAAGDSLALLSLAIPVTLANSTLRGVLEGAARFRELSFVQAPIGAMLYALPAVLVQFGVGIRGIVIALVLTRILQFAVLFHVVRAYVPGMRARVTFDARTLKAQVAFGGWVAVSDLMFPIFTYGDRFFVGALTGPAALPLYSVPQEIVNRLWILPQSVSAASFPSFSAQASRDDRQATAAYISTGIRLVTGVVAPVSALTAVCAHWILQVWIDADFADSAAPVLSVLMLGLLINSIASAPSAALLGYGHSRVRAAVHIVEAIVLVAGMLVLVPALGVIGAAWAWSLRMCATTFTLIVAVKLKTGLSLASFLRQSWRPHIVALSSAIVAGVIAGVAPLPVTGVIVAVACGASLVLYVAPDMPLGVAIRRRVAMRRATRGGAA